MDRRVEMTVGGLVATGVVIGLLTAFGLDAKGVVLAKVRAGNSPKVKQYTETLYTERIYGKDNLRPDITRPADYREADEIFDLSGGDYVVVNRATGQSQGAEGTDNEDWSKGYYLQNRATGQPAWSGSGKPPGLFFRAWATGQPLRGVVIVRDKAQHG